MNDEIFEQIRKSLTVEQIMTPKEEFYFHPLDSKSHKEITIFPIKNEDGSIIKYFDSNGSREHYLDYVTLPSKASSLTSYAKYYVCSEIDDSYWSNCLI